ncbi:MAG: NAD(P)/FAD-dependent oxidoreductase [Thermoplasmatales archaeon]|nr:NAD(P)/FAD-dependent oxidoreductase [Thermoplasmatales archaeon]
MTEKLDAIIVGMNVAGATVSKELASLGVDILVVERLSKDRIGEKTCGDGLEKHEFRRLNLPIPKGDFIIRDITKGELIAPDRKSSIVAQAEGLGINRYHFNQHLVKSAINAGVRIKDDTLALSPLLEGYGDSKRVSGIKIRDKKGEIEKIEAKMVVDCSGLFAKIRNQLPISWWVSEKVSNEDTAVCYRETRVLNYDLDELFVRAYFSEDVAPGAFYWIGCRDLRSLNIGVGVLRVPGYPNPRRQFYTELLPRHPFLKKGKITWKSGGIVPARRPLECMVANGFIAVGDAACQVNPISGGGIGPSLFAGKLAAHIIHKAIEKKNTSIEFLWDYNLKYNHQYGFIQAGGHAMRLGLFSLNDSDINKMLGAKLLSDEEILYAIEHGKLQSGFTSKLKMARKLAKYPKLLLALRKMQIHMEKARSLYLEYPETPKDFLEWRKKVRRFFSIR